MSQLNWSNLVANAKGAMIEQWLMTSNVAQDIAERGPNAILTTVYECLIQNPDSRLIKARCFQILQEVIYHAGFDNLDSRQVEIWILECQQVLRNHSKNAEILPSCLQFASNLPSFLISL